MDTIDQNTTLNDSSYSSTNEQREMQSHEFFICGNCNYVYNEPVTLFCQQTFCCSCLLKMTQSKQPNQSKNHFDSGRILLNEYCNRQNKCPLVISPKVVNFAIDYIESFSTGEEKSERKRDALKKSSGDEVWAELKEELHNAVIEQLDKEGKLNQNLQPFNVCGAQFPQFPLFPQMATKRTAIELTRFAQHVVHAILKLAPCATLCVMFAPKCVKITIKNILDVIFVTVEPKFDATLAVDDDNSFFSSDSDDDDDDKWTELFVYVSFVATKERIALLGIEPATPLSLVECVEPPTEVVQRKLQDVTQHHDENANIVVAVFAAARAVSLVAGLLDLGRRIQYQSDRNKPATSDAHVQRASK